MLIILRLPFRIPGLWHLWKLTSSPRGPVIFLGTGKRHCYWILFQSKPYWTEEAPVDDKGSFEVMKKRNGKLDTSWKEFAEAVPLPPKRSVTSSFLFVFSTRIEISKKEYGGGGNSDRSCEQWGINRLDIGAKLAKLQALYMSTIERFTDLEGTIWFVWSKFCCSNCLSIGALIYTCYWNVSSQSAATSHLLQSAGAPTFTYHDFRVEQEEICRLVREVAKGWRGLNLKNCTTS